MCASPRSVRLHPHRFALMPTWQVTRRKPVQWDTTSEHHADAEAGEIVCRCHESWHAPSCLGVAFRPCLSAGTSRSTGSREMFPQSRKSTTPCDPLEAACTNDRRAHSLLGSLFLVHSETKAATVACSLFPQRGSCAGTAERVGQDQSTKTFGRCVLPGV
jgi:hypothetical protein